MVSETEWKLLTAEKYWLVEEKKVVLNYLYQANQDTKNSDCKI